MVLIFNKCSSLKIEIHLMIYLQLINSFFAILVYYKNSKLNLKLIKKCNSF